MTYKVSLPILMTLLLLQNARAQSEESAIPCDRSKINWVLPGNFAEAVKRARDENRIIMIKGVSFGIDSLGATCATKGKW